MAEEKHLQDPVDHDDMRAMRALLMSVKGLSPVSLAPAFEPAAIDHRPLTDEFQFE